MTLTFTGKTLEASDSRYANIRESMGYVLEKDTLFVIKDGKRTGRKWHHRIAGGKLYLLNPSEFETWNRMK